MSAFRRHRRAARGLTLTELLVAVAIVAVLASVLITAGVAIQKNLRRTRAESQLGMLADAIEKYTQAWPAWKAPDGSALADKGWPDWAASRLFATQTNSQYSGLFPLAPDNFNQPNIAKELNLNDDDNPTQNPPNDTEFAIESMGYCITASVGSGPFLRDPPQNLYNQHVDETYPVLSGSLGGATRFQFIDPWDKQYRYFWVARDPDTTNPSGWRVITTANYTLVDAQGRPIWTTPEGQAFFAPANGCVLESAGPDGRYGNIWKRNPTAAEKADAADNITLKP